MSIFSQIKTDKVRSNTFDLSYDHKLSLNTGQLVPIHVCEVLPGDVFNQSCSSMLRMAPMTSPVMHNVDVTTHFFFVPNRLVWDGWEDFITGNKPPEETPALPYFTGFGVGVGDLTDYMGLPLGTFPTGTKINAIPFAAYQMIYNEYYRNQNLQPEVNYTLLDGQNDITGFFDFRRRSWGHDYFTSALPWAQKGTPVTLPLGVANDVPVVRDAPSGQTTWNVTSGFGSTLTVDNESSPDIPADTLYAKTSDMEIGATTINELRIAVRLQEWLEKNARAGTRYIESLFAHWGVKSDDARLQRPELLGGSIAPMVISEVLQTAATTDDSTPQGNMAGHGISVGQGNVFNYRAKEHGYIIGIMSVRPRTAYQQGVPRFFNKFDMMDYATPEFAHLGEQEILNQELYYDGAEPVTNKQVFGYTPRYADNKYMPSRVSGQYRTTLDHWHWGRIFPSRPGLNSAFVQCQPDKRIFAVEDPEVEELYAHVYHKIRVNRKLPYFGTPTL